MARYRLTTITACRRATCATRISSSSSPSRSTTPTSSPLSCTNFPPHHRRRRLPTSQHPSLSSVTTPRPVSLPTLSHQTTTLWISPSIHSWRRPPTSFSTPSKRTTRNRTTRRTTSDRWAASRRRSRLGRRRGKQRTSSASNRSSRFCLRMSGRNCSSCLTSRAGSRLCSSEGKSNSTRARSTASALWSPVRCSV